MGGMESAVLIAGIVLVAGSAITFVILGFIVQKYNGKNDKINKTKNKKINMAVWDDEYNKQNKNEGKARNNY